MHMCRSWKDTYLFPEDQWDWPIFGCAEKNWEKLKGVHSFDFLDQISKQKVWDYIKDYIRDSWIKGEKSVCKILNYRDGAWAI